MINQECLTLLTLVAFQLSVQPPGMQGQKSILGNVQGNTELFHICQTLSELITERHSQFQHQIALHSF